MTRFAALIPRVREALSWPEMFGFPRKKKIADSQQKLQNLKAQVQDLHRRLQSIESMSAAVPIELNGPGPFRLPLIAEFRSVINDLEERIIADVETRDGRRAYLIIPRLAAVQLINSDLSLPLQNVAVHPSTLIDSSSAANPVRLPLLAHFEGHFYAASNVRVLVLSVEDGRRVFIPTSGETYDQLLAKLEAALAENQPPTDSGELDTDLSDSVGYPLRVRF